MRVLLILLLLGGCRDSTETRLVLAATTSLEDTGLLDSIAAAFAAAHPSIELSPIAVGTGQAFQLGRRGDADILITHDSVGEVALVEAGIAAERRPVMYNDFVIAGPPGDPADAHGSDVLAALKAIARSAAPFVSRGDDSGTHRRELALWEAAGIRPSGNWYVEAGLGQGDALNLASQKGAYLLTDRATYLRFRPHLHLDVVSEGDARLRNTYSVLVLNGKQKAASELFADWLTSEAVERMIGDFGAAEFGRSLFNPPAHGAVPHDTIPTGER